MSSKKNKQRREEKNLIKEWEETTTSTKFKFKLYADSFGQYKIKVFAHNLELSKDEQGNLIISESESFVDFISPECNPEYYENNYYFWLGFAKREGLTNNLFSDFQAISVDWLNNEKQYIHRIMREINKDYAEVTGYSFFYDADILYNNHREDKEGAYSSPSSSSNNKGGF